MMLSEFILACMLVVFFVAFHESLHVLMASKFGIETMFSIVKWHHFPIAISVNLMGFDGRFSELTPAKQYQYAVIALTPYMFIVPLCVVMIAFPLSAMLSLCGWLVILTHAVNLPLEFYDFSKKTGDLPVQRV